MGKTIYWYEHRSKKKKQKETMKNVRKYRNIKLFKIERRRNYLVSEPNYHTIKFFIEHLLATKMKKTGKVMNKPVYLRLSILELIKILMYEFWYDYVKPNMVKKKNCVIWIQIVSLYT